MNVWVLRSASEWTTKHQRLHVQCTSKPLRNYKIRQKFKAHEIRRAKVKHLLMCPLLMSEWVNWCFTALAKVFQLHMWRHRSCTLLIAKLNSYIPLETAQLYFFSSEPFSKTGYWLGICHGWFQLHGLTRASRSENQELQNKKLLPRGGLELTTLKSQSYYRNHRAGFHKHF